MHPNDHHIAQLNIGQLLHPLDDPRTAGFTDNSTKVNAVAERSAGFVWRCLDENDRMADEGISLYDGDPCALATMSVWETPADLMHFVHKTVHGAFLERRAEWFKPQDHKTYVIWPIPAGHTPKFGEGLDHLAQLQADGPTDSAYDFSYLSHQLQAGATE